jgi:hypothetical protein
MVCIAGLNSCDVLERKHQAGVAVEVNGKYLYQSTLDSLTLGLNSEDSMRVAERYIRQWAQDRLIVDNANAQRNDAIENMVNAYRNSLYIQAYEQRLIEKRMPKEVADSTVEQLYAQVADRMLLKESIMKGILVVVANDAPMLSDLRRWLLMANGEKVEPLKADRNKAKHDKNKQKGRKTEKQAEPQEEETNVLDDIEKYAYQYASGYELFTDEWKSASELQLLMPFERNEIDAMLRRSSQIELSDTVNTYILQVMDKRLSGEQMPIDYARPQLEEYILSTRQAAFLKAERERIYEEAVANERVKFYE